MTDFLSRRPLPPITTTISTTKITSSPVKMPPSSRVRAMAVTSTGQGVFQKEVSPNHFVNIKRWLAPCGRDSRAFLTLTVPLPLCLIFAQTFILAWRWTAVLVAATVLTMFVVTTVMAMTEAMIRDDIFCGQDCICCICCNSDNDSCTYGLYGDGHAYGR